MAKKKDTKPKQKQTRQRHDYDKLRAAYRLTPASMTQKQFAEKMGIPVRSLQERMRKDADAGEPWERDLSCAVREKTKQMQQRVAAGLDKDAPVTDEGVAIATAAATNLLVLETHEEIFGEAMHAVKDGISMLRGQIAQGIIVIEERKRGEPVLKAVDVNADYVGKSINSLTNALERTVKMQRHHLGMDDGESDVSYEDDLEALANEMDAEADGEELQRLAAELGADET